MAATTSEKTMNAYGVLEKLLCREAHIHTKSVRHSRQNSVSCAPDTRRYAGHTGRSVTPTPGPRKCLCASTQEERRCVLPLSLSLPTPHAKFRALGKLRAPGFLHAPSRRHLLASRGERGVAKQSRGRELRVRMLLPAGNKCCLQATIRRRPKGPARLLERVLGLNVRDRDLHFYSAAQAHRREHQICSQSCQMCCFLAPNCGADRHHRTHQAARAHIVCV